MRGVPIVPIMRWRKAHPRLGLRIGWCRHITLLAHDENIIPRESSIKESYNRKKKMSTRVVEALNAIDSVSTVHTRF